MYNALIRTHHITSRKKIAALKAAAKKFPCAVLLKSGGPPGVMYVESAQLANVTHWVNVVHGLRYKSYQLVSPPNAFQVTHSGGISGDSDFEFEEVDTVKMFGKRMEERGILHWWRKAMEYTT